MAPKKTRPSTFLKRCSIAVVGGVNKNVKTSDIEKWTVNNGGTYKTKPDDTTTHIVCSWETFRKDDFALPKQHLDNKKLHIVEWGWMADSLELKHARPVKKYLHSRNWDVKAKKKTTRRQALLTGKTTKEVERLQADKKFGSVASDTGHEAENDQDDEDEHDNQDEQDNQGNEDEQNHQGSRNASESAKNSAAGNGTDADDNDEVATQNTSDSVLYEDKNTGIVYDVCLKGPELPDPEDGEYMLSIMQDNSPQPFKACYTYIEGDDEFAEVVIVKTDILEDAISAFEGFFKNKTDQEWSEYCAKLKTPEMEGDKGL